MGIDYGQRLERLRTEMRKANVDIVFLPIAADLQYLTGIQRQKPNYTYAMYPGDWIMGAFIGLEKGPVFILPRMIAQFDLAGELDVHMRVLDDYVDPSALLVQVLDELATGTDRDLEIAVEDRARSELVLNILEVRPEVSLTLASPLLRALRRVKDEEEVALMRRAGTITDMAFADVLRNMQIGMTHLDVYSEVEYQLMRHGADATSFVTGILATGPDVDIPFAERDHGHDVPLPAGTVIAFDLGVVKDGYCSDFGRTVHFGDPTPAYTECFKLVMEAQAAGIAALKAGQITAEEVDAAARQVIVDGGYGNAFLHRLGHGIGMDVHEPPFLDKGDTSLVLEGMVFTIEPSIRTPEEGFIRVEDCVVARPDGGEPLTNFSRELLVVSS